jgi:hypothetical protein
MTIRRGLAASAVGLALYGTPEAFAAGPVKLAPDPSPVVRAPAPDPVPGSAPQTQTQTQTRVQVSQPRSPAPVTRATPTPVTHASPVRTTAAPLPAATRAAPRRTVRRVHRHAHPSAPARHRTAAPDLPPVAASQVPARRANDPSGPRAALAIAGALLLALALGGTAVLGRTAQGVRP